MQKDPEKAPFVLPHSLSTRIQHAKSIKKLWVRVGAFPGYFYFRRVVPVLGVFMDGSFYGVTCFFRVLW